MNGTNDWAAKGACRTADPDMLFVQGAAQNRAKAVAHVLTGLTVATVLGELTLSVTPDTLIGLLKFLRDELYYYSRDENQFLPTNFRRGATATTKINRADFGLTWNKALETGGVVVGEEVTITIDVEAMRPGVKK